MRELRINFGPARAARIGRPRRLDATTRSHFLKSLWTVAAAFVGYSIVTCLTRPATFTISALFIAFFALLPSYLWCRGKVQGTPIFPLFCAMYLITHAFQLIVFPEGFKDYASDAIWRAALTVSGFLLLGTLAWWFWLDRPRTQPVDCLILGGESGISVLLFVTGACAGFTLASLADWTGQLPTGVFTTINGFIGGLNKCAVFMLAMLWGARKMRSSQVFWFVMFFLSYCTAEAASLLLVSAIQISFVMVAGYFMGRKAVPWGMIAVIVVVSTILHAGKGEMRTHYWEIGQRHIVQPWRYPDLFAEWMKNSFDALAFQHQGGAEKSPTIFQRSDVIHLLLQAQQMTPSEVSFLSGQTYAIIPDALLPRILYSAKTSPHDSTTLLNVAYGNQTWETARTTSIGWGLLNEAYANFGMAGCCGLALVLGAFCALVTRWSIGLPPTSLATLVGAFTMSFMLQTEVTAAIFITSYVQGLFALFIFTFPFTKRVPIKLTPAALGQAERRHLDRFPSPEGVDLRERGRT